MKQVGLATSLPVLLIVPFPLPSSSSLLLLVSFIPLQQNIFGQARNQNVTNGGKGDDMGERLSTRRRYKGSKALLSIVSAKGKGAELGFDPSVNTVFFYNLPFSTTEEEERFTRYHHPEIRVREAIQVVISTKVPTFSPADGRAVVVT